MSIITRKKLAVGAAVAVVAIGGGTAYAYWSTSGSGTGSAATSAGAANLTITQTSTIAGLAPGIAPQGITGTVTNNAANSAYVTKVVVSIASVTGGAGACTAGDYTLTGTDMAVNQDLASGGTANFGGAQLSFNNKADANQDGCKGATVNLAYAAS